MRIDPNAIKLQIGQLLLAFPELAEDEILRADTFESESDLHAFLAGLVRNISDAQIMIDGGALRIRELLERSARFERRIEAYRTLATNIMQAANLRKVVLPVATLSIRHVPPKVLITDEESLPDLACKNIRKPDLKRIKELLADGMVAGAAMSNGSEALTILVK